LAVIAPHQVTVFEDGNRVSAQVEFGRNRRVKGWDVSDDILLLLLEPHWGTGARHRLRAKIEFRG
jgi:hypothetical protein